MEMAVRSVHMQIHFYTMESNLHVLHIQLAGSRARSQSQIRMVNGTKRGNNSLLSVCRTTFGHTYISGIFARKKTQKKLTHTETSCLLDDLFDVLASFPLHSFIVDHLFFQV